MVGAATVRHRMEPHPGPVEGTSTTALAVDIGGTKLAVGARRRRRTAVRPAHGAHARPGRRRGALGRARHASSTRSAAATRPSSGVGCGGPMTPDGEAVSPLNIPAWRAFPLRARLAGLTGLPVHVDNDAKALALGEGWVGRRPRRPRLPGHGGVHGRRRGDRARRAPARRRGRQRRPRRARHRRARRARVRLRGPRLPRGRGVRHRHPRRPRAGTRPPRTRRSAGGRARWSAGRWRRS